MLQLTRNPLQVSAIAAVEMVAYAVLRVPFGALADRRGGRRLMITADIARTLLTLAVPVTAALRGPVLAVVYAVTILLAAFSALFESASGVAVPLLVSADQRGRAYAWQEGLESAAWVIGPPLGGLLAAGFGAGRALGLDSVSFVVSVAGLLAVRPRFSSPSGLPGPSCSRKQTFRGLMQSGLRLMLTDRVLRRDQLVWSAYSVLGSGIILGLVFVSTGGGKSGGLLATLAVAAYAAGSGVGTLVAGRSGTGGNPWLAIAGGFGMAGAGALLVAVSGVSGVLPGGALFGVGEGAVLVFHLTLRGRATPEGYFGRVTGIAGMLGQVTSAFSMLWLGLVLRLTDGHVTFVVLGVAILAVGVAVAVAPAPPVPAAVPPEPAALPEATGLPEAGGAHAEEAG